MRDFPTVRACEFWGMRPGTVVKVNGADRYRLDAIVADRNIPQKQSGVPDRARDSGRPGYGRIMRQTGKSKTGSGAGRSALR